MFQELVTWFVSVGAWVDKVSFTTTSEVTATMIDDGEKVTVVLSERVTTRKTYGAIASTMKWLLDHADCASALVGMRNLDVGTL